MTSGFMEFAEVIDGGDTQSPASRVSTSPTSAHIVRASDEQGVKPAPIAMVQALIRRQVAAGHGSEGFARIYESLRATDRPGSRRRDRCGVSTATPVTVIGLGEAAGWVEDHGATLVTGGVMVPSPDGRHRGGVRLLQRVRCRRSMHIGPRSNARGDTLRRRGPRSGQLLYQAHLDVFLTTLSSLLHATALAGSAGIAATESCPS